MIQDCKEINMDDIEEMILLADDVVKQIFFNYRFYDTNGSERELEEVILDTRNNEDKSLLHILKRSNVCLQDALNVSADSLRCGLLKPYLKKALGIFHNGTIQDTVFNDTNFRASDSISNEYLLNLFAMRVRDFMIIYAVQRVEKDYYLLLWGHEACHDMDQWIGIYHRVSDLKSAYKEAWREEKQEPSANLMIYRFTERKYGFIPVQPQELWYEEA